MPQILFQNDDLVVCIKPVGADSEHDMPALLKETVSGTFLPVHRLDRNVAGVMVYARNSLTAAALSKAIQNGDMIKEYTAVVHGTPPESGEFCDLLFKDSRKNKVFIVKRQRAGVKEAKLAFTRLSAGDTSTVHIRLYTGRSHQIRVQFAGRGFPLVGDHKYGARDNEKLPRLFASRLSFPYRGETLCFEATPSWDNS